MLPDLTHERDEALLRLSMKRPAVFEILVERYQAPFLRRANHVLRNREDAEDAVQEAFVKIYMNAGRYEEQEGANFGSWAYKILLNTCYTIHQKRKRSTGKRTEIEDEEFFNLAGKDNALRDIEFRDLAASLLSNLPKHMHRVLHLHFIMGYRQAEIAEMEGETVGAVKTRIFRRNRN